MIPADQRFASGEMSGLDIDLWLVMQCQCLLFNCLAQFGGNHEPLRIFMLYGALIDKVRNATVFRSPRRNGGSAYQQLCLIAMSRKKAGSDCYLNLEMCAADFHRAVTLLQDKLDHGFCRTGIALQQYQ